MQFLQPIKNNAVHNVVLVTRLRKGDELAFETIYRLYFDKLLVLANNYLTYNEDSKSVVQNVFLKLWENRTALDENLKLNNYLYTICKNECLDILKHNKIVRNYKEVTANKNEILQNFLTDESASLLLKNELEKAILKSIELLPERCKVIFIKKKVEGLSHKVIAKELGISTKTVENHITIAIKHMKNQLKDFLSIVL